MASRRPLALLLLAACLSFQPFLHAQSPPVTPIGHWVAEHPSKGGIGSWWDFRSDGTLTLHIGAMVTIPIVRSGNTYTAPPGTIGGPPVRIQYRIEGASLVLVSNGQETTYTRIGSAPNPSDPLLGKWRPDPPKTPDPNPNAALLEKARSNGIHSFSADGTESVRIPFTSREGTWDAAAHTLRFPNDPTAYSYQLSDGKLILAQPPDGKQTDTYLVDPLYP